MESKVRSRVVTGVMLILLGLALFGIRYIEGLGESVLLLCAGGLFIAGYLFTRVYLLLILGCILFGLGVGSFGERYFYVWGEFSEIGLGVGFVLVYLIKLVYERCSHWWPLIPGGVLILLGLQSWGRVWRFLLSDGWPLILVIIGVLVLLGTLGRERRKKK
jgi:hypothetical protein